MRDIAQSHSHVALTVVPGGTSTQRSHARSPRGDRSCSVYTGKVLPVSKYGYL